MDSQGITFDVVSAATDPVSRALTVGTAVVGIAGAPVANALDSPDWVPVALAALGLGAILARGAVVLGAMYLEIRKAEASTARAAALKAAGLCPYSADGSRACQATPTPAQAQ
jgi:hypothetical protein